LTKLKNINILFSINIIWRLVMKGKNFVFLVIMFVMIGLTLNAQEGYQGPGLTPITIQEAIERGNSPQVTLRGKIEAFLWNEPYYPVDGYYVFSDETGSITIRIPNMVWKGVSVNENDLVEIYGEIEDGGQTFYVKRIKKV
jgi:uncharacterized protein (TIGR00156 family)